MTTDSPMQLGMIGLGRMGANLVRRLMRDGHQCVVFDVNPATVQQLASEGATGATSIAEFVAKLTPQPTEADLLVEQGLAAPEVRLVPSDHPAQPGLQGRNARTELVAVQGQPRRRRKARGQDGPERRGIE